MSRTVQVGGRNVYGFTTARDRFNVAKAMIAVAEAERHPEVLSRYPTASSYARRVFKLD